MRDLGSRIEDFGLSKDTSKPATQELALFDLDNTLLSGDSDHGWSQFLIEEGVLDRATFERRNDAFFEQYKTGTLDIYEYVAFHMTALGRYSRAQLDAWHVEFMHKKIRPMITQKSRELIAQHQARGALCAIVTATNSFVTAPIAAELNVPHLLATEPEEIDGRFTGRVSGVPCFREGKITRVDEFLSERGQTMQGFSESYFYSDSLNDLPLLSRVNRPVAVDPDPTLRAHAEQRGWPVISLRH
jgi:HAD superfamily hydrolase (TIGR01490 family)